jgi:hypothetical protein
MTLVRSAGCQRRPKDRKMRVRLEVARRLPSLVLVLLGQGRQRCFWQ